VIKKIEMNQPLLHLANVLYLCSYSVRDILWLRMITIVAMLLLGGYYLLTDQMAPVYWQAAFLAINLFHVGLLIRERRPIELSDEESLVHQQALKNLTAHQVRKLMMQVEWKTAEVGETILAEGIPNSDLRLLLDGQATVSVSGRPIAQLEPCQFFGEMSFLTGSLTSAAVIASTPVRYVLLSEQRLLDLTGRDPEFAKALQAAIGNDLVHKLLRLRNEHTDGETSASLTLS
jgi:Popeye protein conserved region